MGRAPTSGTPSAPFWCGFHVVPAKKDPSGMPSFAKVEMPLEHTMKMSVSTKTTTSMTQRPVRIWPLRSIRRLGETPTTSEDGLDCDDTIFSLD